MTHAAPETGSPDRPDVSGPTAPSKPPPTRTVPQTGGRDEGRGAREVSCGAPVPCDLGASAAVKASYSSLPPPTPTWSCTTPPAPGVAPLDPHLELHHSTGA